MTPRQRAWKSVYRWRSIGRRLWRARNLRPLAISANIGYRFYAHNLHRFYTCDLPIDAALPHPAGLWPGAKLSLNPAPETNRGVCGG